jgi:hypothetical protein
MHLFFSRKEDPKKGGKVGPSLMHRTESELITTAIMAEVSDALFRCLTNVM